MKYYAVRKGKTPGIYTDWPACEMQVKGYPGAEYKSFKSMDEANAYMGIDAGKDTVSTNDEPVDQTANLDLTYPYAFVDGSYNIKTGIAGCGGFLQVDADTRYPISMSVDDPEMNAMRNVAGETLGAQKAVELALVMGLESLTIYYDYMGIEQWVTGGWKCNKEGTIAYRDFMRAAMSQIKITFVKVAAHTGIPGNEEADRMAKKCVGIL